MGYGDDRGKKVGQTLNVALDAWVLIPKTGGELLLTLLPNSEGVLRIAPLPSVIGTGSAKSVAVRVTIREVPRP